MIWNEKYCIAGSIYNGVQSIYKYGCNHCRLFGKQITHLEGNRNVCDRCYVKLRTNQTPPNEMIKTLINDFKTGNVIGMNKINGMESRGTKRGYLPDSDDDTANVKAAPTPNDGE